MLALLATLAFATDLDFGGEAPQSVQADHQDRFYIDFGDRVIRWTNAEDMVFTYPPPDGWKQRAQHAVSPVDGTIHSVLERWKNECVDQSCSETYTQFEYVYSRCDANGQCQESGLASERTTHGLVAQSSYVFKLDVTEKGRILLKKIRKTDDGNELSLSCGTVSQSCDDETFDALPYQDLPTPVDYRCRGSQLVGGELAPEAQGKKPPSSRAQVLGEMRRAVFDTMANIDTACLFDRTGRPYLFRQGGDKRLKVFRVVDGELVETTVDGPESGAANAAVRHGDNGVVAFHYFYRNSYHKGVRATVWEDGMADPVWTGDIFASRDLNPGRRFLVAATPQGRIAAAWPNDARKKKEGWTIRTWDHPGQLQQDEVAAPDGWEAKHKNWFVMAGAGAGYAMWTFSSPGPDEEGFVSVPAEEAVLDSAYSVAPSIMTSATLEARYGVWSFGASYARGLLEDAADEAGLSSKQFDRLYGQLGVDQIIKYHDIRVAFRAGRVDMGYQINSSREGVSDAGTLASNYRRIDVYLLNTWRVRYGLFNQSYRAALPFYVWAIDEGQTSYRYIDSFPSTLQFNDYGLTVGYSRLDYAAKFENKVTAPFIDADVGLGFSSARLDSSYTPEDTDTGTTTAVTTYSGDTLQQAEPEAITRSTTFMIPFNLEAGGILLRRTAKLRGLGWYGRVGYRVTGSISGSASKPADLDEAATSARQRVTYSRFELRHGPFFGVGAVF